VRRNTLKASQLVKLLESAIKKHGDQPIEVTNPADTKQVIGAFGIAYDEDEQGNIIAFIIVDEDEYELMVDEELSENVEG